MRRALILLAVLSLPLSALAGDVWRSVDANGHVQYSDVPTPGATLVATSDEGAGSSNAATATDTPSTDSSKALQKQNSAISARLAQQAAARAVAQDTAQARAEQCKQAQQQYQQAVQARRLYRTDANGQRQYLSDQEADQERVTYRLAMESACGQS